MVPQPDGLIMTVAGQEVPEWLNATSATSQVWPVKTLGLSAGQPVPDVDLVVVARGREEFSIPDATPVPRRLRWHAGDPAGACHAT